jgi:hypothetical protein
MKLLKLFTLALAAAAASSALGWNYTVHNNTSYNLIAYFALIGAPVPQQVMLPANTSTNVISWVGPIDYCYSGFHLLSNGNHQLPEIYFNGKPAVSSNFQLPRVELPRGKKLTSQINQEDAPQINFQTYTAPWIPIPGDACWNKTITLYYNHSSNQIDVSVE